MFHQLGQLLSCKSEQKTLVWELDCDEENTEAKIRGDQY